MKLAVLEAIGEEALSQSARILAGLEANNRLKYFLTLLQTAAEQADHPDREPPSLARERIACGIDDAGLDETVPGARRVGDGYRIPGSARLIGRIAEDLRVMAEPVMATDDPGGEFARRLDTLLGALPKASDDVLARAAITEMTRAGGQGSDSVHQLVMDLHKTLNRLAAESAEEKLDGASVSRLQPEDRPLVAAFMKGVNRTAPLKFGHPGLGCTATRSARGLVIQNDIGLTDAHVIVIHVAGSEVTLTYTDVHPERLRFLQDMLARFKPSWSGEPRHGKLSAGKDGAFVLATGRFVASGPPELESYLEFLGSRLVFLIDWNRARRQLRGFLPGSQRLELLLWAAEAEIGHRAFLEVGGARLINEAIEATAGSAVHFGDRLSDVLGVPATLSFLRFVFRTACEGLQARHSRTFIFDRICTELVTHFSNESRRLLRVALDHAGLVFELATLVRDGLQADTLVSGGSERIPALARDFEHDADQLLVQARELVRRRQDQSLLVKLLETADDAADYLEEAAFLVHLLAPTSPAPEPRDALAALAHTLLSAAQEWVKTVANAAHVDRPKWDVRGDGSAFQDDAGDFLAAVDRVAALEHQADDAERALTIAAVQHARDFRQLHLLAEIGGSLEAAADALKRASLMAHEHVLGSLLRD